jgi:hypothetical protein
MEKKKFIFGIEEEVFLLQGENPTLSSLYYLAKLLWKNPRFYYTHTASNFARGRDIKKAIMGGVEISTMVAERGEVIKDLKERREDLIEACGEECLIVPLGSLLHLDAPSLTCALQIHISGVKDMELAYKNLAYFLPLLALITVNSPAREGKYFGQSYRIYHSFAIGSLKNSPLERFQDIIISRRLNTIELRIFDSTWDVSRIEVLLELIEAILSLKEEKPLDFSLYKERREKLALYGYCKEIEPLYRELGEFSPISRDVFIHTPSEEVWSFYEKNGLKATYEALDNAYRKGKLSKRERGKMGFSLGKAILGIAGYYVPKIPFMIWKFGREHGYI